MKILHKKKKMYLFVKTIENITKNNRVRKFRRKQIFCDTTISEILCTYLFDYSVIRSNDLYKSNWTVKKHTKMYKLFKRLSDKLFYNLMLSKLIRKCIKQSTLGSITTE